MLGCDDADCAADRRPAGRAFRRLAGVGDAGGGRALAGNRARSYQEPWLQLVQSRAARLDLTPLLAVLPRRGYVPDFLTPPPRAPGRVFATSSRRSARPTRHRLHANSSGAGRVSATSRIAAWSMRAAPGSPRAILTGTGRGSRSPTRMGIGSARPAAPRHSKACDPRALARCHT